MGLLERLGFHVHGHDHGEIVARRDDAGEDENGGERDLPGLRRRHEDVPLADEACGAREAEQREHAHGQGESEPRPALGQSRQVVDADVALPVATLGREQREGRQGHERVGDEVEDECRRARGGSGRHRDQHVAGVRDGRVGEHPLEGALGEGDEVSDQHGDHGEPPHDLAPCGHGAERLPQHAEQRGECGRLDRGRHVAGDRRGRAVVHVRGPHVEGHRGHLESEADQQQPEADEEHGALLEAQGRHLDADERQVGGGRRSVGEGDAVQQEPGGERAEEEVLQGRLGGGGAATVDPREHVHRDRHQLEAEEDHHEVLASGHQHHAQRGEEQQHVILGREQALALEIVERDEDRQCRGAEDQPVRDEPKVVHSDHGRVDRRGDHRGARRVPPQPPDRDGGGHEPPPRHPSGDPQVRAGLVPPGDDEQQHHRSERQHQLGQQGECEIAVVREVEAHRPRATVADAARTVWMSCCALGSIRRSNGLG